MMLQDTIDDLDSVIAELADLRQTLIVAQREARPADVLWDVEYALMHAAARAERRAATVRRVIELLGESGTAADVTGSAQRIA